MIAGRFRRVAVMLFGTASVASAQTPLNRPVVEASLDSLMRAYAAAFEARADDRVVGFYAPGPETVGWNDGRAYTYEAIVAGLRDFIRATRSVSIKYETVRARAITNDLGTVWTTLRETWTDDTGKADSIRVRASWVARRIEGEWRLVYFDGRHESLPAATPAKP